MLLFVFTKPNMSLKIYQIYFGIDYPYILDKLIKHSLQSRIAKILRIRTLKQNKD